MTRLSWSATDKRFFEAGLDRGVFYPKVGAAVPWQGLVSVEEDSSDSVVSYYIDGRPFLHFPPPREFKATLSAYTYPDEFSEVMGFAEVTDVAGAYLDSQIADSFDLSYRTLVGDSISGLDRGYKIHLVYNATVTPQGASYETLSSEINPSTFSWQINAVPMNVPGYRPTAHMVIDTRNMVAADVAIIEALIYGDSTTSASMPEPFEILEILRFGDTILITDYGDGTWSAEGSAFNIYMVSDDVFQIDDVNAVNNGNGTFDISTTNP